jgi:uncharacterized protein YjbI with pentapeptide repeats
VALHDGVSLDYYSFADTTISCLQVNRLESSSHLAIEFCYGCFSHATISTFNGTNTNDLDFSERMFEHCTFLNNIVISARSFSNHCFYKTKLSACDLSGSACLEFPTSLFEGSTRKTITVPPAVTKFGPRCFAISYHDS